VTLSIVGESNVESLIIFYKEKYYYSNVSKKLERTNLPWFITLC